MILGYHLVKSTYGSWLPGDERGHWSSAWDEQIGYCQPHHLHEGDPVRKRMAEELMVQPAVRLTPEMLVVVEDVLGECQTTSPWKIAAAAIEPTHFHLLMTYSDRPIDATSKWLAQQMTKAIHTRTPHQGHVWSKGKWASEIEDGAWWECAREYIEDHNNRRGVGPRPYKFLY